MRRLAATISLALAFLCAPLSAFADGSIVDTKQLRKTNRGGLECLYYDEDDSKTKNGSESCWGQTGGGLISSDGSSALCYLASIDGYYNDRDGDCVSLDPAEGDTFVNNGDLIETSVGGAVQGGAHAYYARHFDSASSQTDGIQEAVDHCGDLTSSSACTVLVGCGVYDQFGASPQISTAGHNAVTIQGCGSATQDVNTTRIRLLTTLTTSNANCIGEEQLGGSHDANPQCAQLILAGPGMRLKDLILENTSNRADVTLEIASRMDDGANTDTGPEQYSTHGAVLDGVSFRDGDNAQLMISNRDGDTSSRADQLIGNHVRFRCVSSFCPKYNAYVDNANTSGNLLADTRFGGYRVAGVNIRMGEFHVDGAVIEQTSGVAATYFQRFCSDLLSDSDSSIVGAETCGGTSAGNHKRFAIWRSHMETSTNGGGFMWYHEAACGGLNPHVSVVENSIIITGGTSKYFDIDTCGNFYVEHNTFSANSAAVSDLSFDCNSGIGCTGADEDTLLRLTMIGNRIVPWAAALDVDDANDHIVREGSVLYSRLDGYQFFDRDGDGLPDTTEQKLTWDKVPDVRATTQALTGEDCSTGLITNEGAAGTVTYTLPTNPRLGLTCWFIQVTAQVVVLDPQGAASCSIGAACDRVLVSTNANGDRVSCDAVIGNVYGLVALDADRWYPMASVAGCTDID